MTDCTHPRIITYHDADTGKPISLWACAECSKRFEPLVDDTALLKQALDALDEGDTVFYPKTKLAIAALRERLKP